MDFLLPKGISFGLKFSEDVCFASPGGRKGCDTKYDVHFLTLPGGGSLMAALPVHSTCLTRRMRCASCLLRTVPSLHLWLVHRSSESSSPPNQRHEEASKEGL